ncbi:ATP-binding protein [Nonomuraea ferruginea]
MPRSGAPSDPAERLADALRTRRTLLVLDNCEHVIDEVAALSERLLRAAPEVRILATSQEPLGLAGESVWPVPPLEAPLSPAETGVATLRRFSAVRLFEARAAAAVPGFVIDHTNARVVAAICRRLDGVPLALELAATRLRALDVHDLAERLDDRFRLLSSGHRGAPARQRTLRAMIDWSWELLSEPERLVLRRLAVHTEGCALEAAEVICADGGDVAPEDVLDLLARLADRSMVVRAGGAGSSRYRLLESVAAYALDRLEEAGETERIRLRHLIFHTELAERAEPRLHGPDQRRWLRRLDAEHGNLRAALEEAVRRQDADLALRLVNALAWYWFLRGRIGEGWRAFTMALAIRGRPPPRREHGPRPGRPGWICWASVRRTSVRLRRPSPTPANAPERSGSSATCCSEPTTWHSARTWSTGRSPCSSGSATAGAPPRPWPPWPTTHSSAATSARSNEPGTRAWRYSKSWGDRWGAGTGHRPARQARGDQGRPSQVRRSRPHRTPAGRGTRAVAAGLAAPVRARPDRPAGRRPRRVRPAPRASQDPRRRARLPHRRDLRPHRPGPHRPPSGPPRRRRGPHARRPRLGTRGAVRAGHRARAGRARLRRRAERRRRRGGGTPPGGPRRRTGHRRPQGDRARPGRLG